MKWQCPLRPLAWLCFGLGLLVLSLPAPGAEAPTPRFRPLLERPAPKPNIIFILADDLGYGDLGCYGQTKIQTPNLDRFAAEGMRFTQAYAGSPVCAPSRAVLLTGRHVGHTRIRGNSTLPLLPEEVTVAEVLKPAGYVTGAVGKWGLGLEGSTGTPSRQGFDEWFGFLSQTLAHNYYPTQLWRSSRSLGYDQPLEDEPVPIAANFGGAKGRYAQDLFTMAATNFVRVNKLAPFFLYLAYTIPHAHNELKDKGMEVPSDAPYSQEDWPQPEKNKAAMITRLDADIGRLLAQLKALQIESNTVVFFTSDNGPHKEGGVRPDFFRSSGLLRGLKRDVYEGGIRVPMLVRWPGRIAPGTVSDQVWHFPDFLPTAAEIAGVQPPPGVDGISILPTLLGQAQTNQHEYLYWEFHEGGSKQAVRLGDWKGVRLEPGQPLELYDLKTDAGETKNVAAAHPDVVARIEAILKTARTESEPWPLRTAAEWKKARPAEAKKN
jgi:arylsulfatase A-like enzyme